MKQYNVTGMHCAACQARVEKAVSALPGVTGCAVSLLTNSMGVEGSVSETAVIGAVEKAGYGASVKGAATGGSENPAADALKDHETPQLKRRLFFRYRISCSPDVLLHGPQHVGLAAAGFSCG